MRTILLLLAAILATSSTMAQSIAGPNITQTDELDQQKRQLSGELKNTLGMVEALIKRSTTLATAASGTEQEECAKMAAELKGLHARLTDELGAVNQANAGNSGTMFAAARELMGSTQKAIGAHKGRLDAILAK